jgi:hypothetical protein
MHELSFLCLKILSHHNLVLCGVLSVPDVRAFGSYTIDLDVDLDTLVACCGCSWL